MSMISEKRFSDSPYVESVMRGLTLSEGTSIRPAEIHWHMVFVKHQGGTQVLAVGPLTRSGIVSWGEGGEILWIKLKLGVFMPHLPMKSYVNAEQTLPDASRDRFWLKGAAWQIPDFENVETFIERLVREEDLVHDPLVRVALQEAPAEVSPRTVRHRFLQATGQTQKHIHQYERAIKAASLLRHGVPIMDTVFEAGYFDQPHLTRSLRRFLGYTPAQILHESQP